MKKLLALLLALAACAQPKPEAPERMVAALATENLYVVELPEGDSPGFTIDVPGWTGHAAAQKLTSATWLSQGYTGVLFRGKGRGKSHIRPGNAESTIIFDRHPGTVRFEGVTIHCGSRHGVFAGLEHRNLPLQPKFRLEMQDFEVLADGVRTTWGVFSYACDQDLRDGLIDVRNGMEHSSYSHGYAGKGATWVRVTSRSAAEGFKVRSDTGETAWAGPNVALSLTGCVFDNWYVPWSNRGGGGVVLQGGACDLTVQGCLFRNKGDAPDPDGEGPLKTIPASQRTRAIMLDDGGGDFWGTLDGKKGSGFATGHVLIRGCGFDVGPGTENLSIVIRVGNLGGGSHRIARSLRVLDNALYGEKLQLQLGNLPPGKLRVAGNNTEAIKGLATAFGLDTKEEVWIPLSNKLIPVSQGLSR